MQTTCTPYSIGLKRFKNQKKKPGTERLALSLSLGKSLPFQISAKLILFSILQSKIPNLASLPSPRLNLRAIFILTNHQI